MHIKLKQAALLLSISAFIASPAFGKKPDEQDDNNDKQHSSHHQEKSSSHHHDDNDSKMYFNDERIQHINPGPLGRIDS